MAQALGGMVTLAYYNKVRVVAPGRRTGTIHEQARTHFPRGPAGDLLKTAVAAGRGAVSG